MKTHSTVSTKTCNVSLCSLKKKAKITTRQILFTPKTLNFDIAKNTSLKVIAEMSRYMCKRCSKEYQHASSLSRHIKKEHGEKFREIRNLCHFPGCTIE